MESALSYINVLPSTGSEQDIFANQVIESVKAGQIDALKLDIQLKSIENTIDMIRKSKSVKEAVINEYSKYLGEGKTIELHGAKINVSERKKWTYKDDEYEALNKELEEIKARIKSREIILQAMDFDPATGAEIKKKCEVSQVVKITF